MRKFSVPGYRDRQAKGLPRRLVMIETKRHVEARVMRGSVVLRRYKTNNPGDRFWDCARAIYFAGEGFPNALTAYKQIVYLFARNGLKRIR